MPAKAKLTTRERTTSNVSSDNLNKGAELTFAEADSNFFNLRDQSIAISDGATSTDIEAGETITFSGASVSGNTVTISAASSTETVTALTSSTGISVDRDSGSVFTVTLGHNTTFTFSNFDQGETISIRIKQDTTGGRTASFTGVVFPDGDNLLSTAANAVDFVTIFNDGTYKLGAINRAYS